jgi:hypothetical protein
VDDGAERVYAQTNHEDGLWVKKKKLNVNF